MTSQSEPVAVILAGGVGQRFWPASRQDRPKQFLRLFGKNSLIQETAYRLAGLFDFGRMLVVTGESQTGLTTEHLPELPSENVVGEPASRNTAPALALAAIHIRRRFGDVPVIVLPADHHVPDPASLRASLVKAIEMARESDSLVTFGVVPTRAETEYGYIEVGPVEASGFHRVERFMEKPSPERAAEFLASGRHLWNSGMFAWRNERFLAELALRRPAIAERFNALAPFLGTPEYPARLVECYRDLEAVSVDRAVMERSRNLLVLPVDFPWDDLGAWSTLARHLPPDGDGNVVLGRDVHLLDTRGCIIYGDDRRIEVVGGSDLVVAASGNGVLVSTRGQMADVQRLPVGQEAPLDLSLDRAGMLGWLADYPNQLRRLYPEGFRAGRAARAGQIGPAPRSGHPLGGVVLLGTGDGSTAAAHVVASLVRERAEVPFSVHQGYQPPAHACRPDSTDLIVAISHSGTTEETLTAYGKLPPAAKNRTVVISGGGPLVEAARAESLPLVSLPTGMQTRAVFPGVVATLIGLLDGAGLTAAGFGDELDEACTLASELAGLWGPPPDGTSPQLLQASQSPTPLGLARLVADRLLLIYGGAGATDGIARRWKNQLAENGKTLAHWYTVPEAHHDEVVGWDAPAAVREHLHGCLLRDPVAESDRMRKRLDATARLLAGRVSGVTEVAARGRSALARAVSLCLYGDYLSCYVALLRGIDPTPDR
jgi:mannose-1-phosphate guanylyltransferase